MKKFFILSISSFILAISLYGCSQNEQNIEQPPKPKKYELVAIKIYAQNGSNLRGEIIRSEEHIKYSFIDSKGKIISNDRNFEGNQKDIYRLHKSKDKESYVLDKSDYSNASLDFYLTEYMYKNIYK